MNRGELLQCGNTFSLAWLSGLCMDYKAWAVQYIALKHGNGVGVVDQRIQECERFYSFTYQICPLPFRPFRHRMNWYLSWREQHAVTSICWNGSHVLLRSMWIKRRRRIWSRFGDDAIINRSMKTSVILRSHGVTQEPKLNRTSICILNESNNL